MLQNNALVELISSFRKLSTNCQILMNKEWVLESWVLGNVLGKAKQIPFSRTGQHKWTRYGEALRVCRTHSGSG